jgi:hypothetical protein
MAANVKHRNTPETDVPSAAVLRKRCGKYALMATWAGESGVHECICIII